MRYYLCSGVQTRALNQAVKRNLKRFPGDFLFQLSATEFENWRSQIVISNPGARMALRRRPFAFTEHGALMAATVLNSARATEPSNITLIKSCSAGDDK